MGIAEFLEQSIHNVYSSLSLPFESSLGLAFIQHLKSSEQQIQILNHALFILQRSQNTDFPLYYIIWGFPCFENFINEVGRLHGERKKLLQPPLTLSLPSPIELELRLHCSNTFPTGALQLCRD
jgi:hypothetical protein